MSKLFIYENNSLVKELNVDKDIITLGRMPENDIEIRNALVSRKHAEIKKKGDILLIHDLGSSNGTFLNGELINANKLSHEDEINIGETVILVSLKDDYTPKKIISPILPSEELLLPISQEEDMLSEDGPYDNTDYESKSDIIKSLSEISEQYNFDVSQSISQGVSLKDISLKKISPIADKSENIKESGKFFILYQLGKEITPTKTLDETLALSLKVIFDLIQADRGVIMLLNKQDGSISPKLAMTRNIGIVPNDEINVSRTIVNRVLKQKISLISSDTKHDPRLEEGISIVQLNIRSALCVPLWEKDDVLGVIYLDNLITTYSFSQEDMGLLTAIANLIAIRIKQEQLYNELKEEAIKRDWLEKYHSPDVVNYILSNKSSSLIDRVEDKIATVLFVDIEDFTGKSEKLTPGELAKTLNQFFELSTNVIFQHKGSINKYIGDAIMATFGAPISYEDHAAKAVRTGLGIIEEIKKLNSYNIRIGINTGHVIAGNIGSEKRLEYTVLGDAVNVAKRMEELANSNELYVGESTFNMLENKFNYEDLGLVKAKGKSKEIKAYKILSERV